MRDAMMHELRYHEDQCMEYAIRATDVDDMRGGEN